MDKIHKPPTSQPLETQQIEIAVRLGSLEKRVELEIERQRLKEHALHTRLRSLEKRVIELETGIQRINNKASSLTDSVATLYKRYNKRLVLIEAPHNSDS